MNGLLCLAMVLFTAPQSAPDELFYRAFYLEVAARDFSQAREAYAKAAEASASSKRADLTARCWLGEARCAKALGQTEAATALIRKALELDPGNAEAKAALAAPSAEDLELANYLGDLIRKLGGPEREQAGKDLVLAGASAVPQLERTLRSKEVGLVSEVANVLGAIDDPAAREVLKRAPFDPEVMYPDVILGAADHFPRNGALVEVFDAWLAKPEADFRTKVVGKALVWRDRSFGKGVPNGFPLFVERVLADPSSRVRIAAMSSVADVASSARLRDCLVSEDVDLRRAALIASLNRSFDPDLLARVTANLADPDAQIRSRALDVLDRWMNQGNASRTDREACFEALVTRLADTDVVVAEAAAHYVSNKDVAWSENTARLVDEWLRRMIEKGDAPNWNPNVAVQVVQNPRAGALGNERLLSLYALAGSPSSKLDASAFDASPSSVRDAIVKRLFDNFKKTGDDPAAYLARGLREIGDEAGKIQWLTTFQRMKVASGEGYVLGAGDPSPAVRAQSYNCLLGTPSPVATAPLPHLNEDLVSSDQTMRSESLRVAEKLPQVTYADGLRKRRAQPQKDERWLVLRALVACAGKEALPDVRADLASDDREAQNEACRAIVNLLGPDAVADLAAFAARTEGSRPLEPFLEGSGISIPPDVLAAYLEALPPDRYSGLLLVYAAKVENPRLQPVLRKIILRLLASNDGSERTAASMAGKLHVEEAWPHLIALLESPRSGTREAAKQALDEIRAYRELRASFEQFGEGGRAKALQDAKALLKSESAEKRRGAALAIGALGDPGGVPALLELLSDPDAAVRAAALQALERLGGKPN